MTYLSLNQVKRNELELGKSYLVMFHDEGDEPYYEFATYYYESSSNMYLWCFEDESDPFPVGEEIAIFETPENGIIYGDNAEFLGKEDIIEDGFGSVWSAWCPLCKKKTMFVVRPGQVQCGNCE